MRQKEPQRMCCSSSSLDQLGSTSCTCEVATGTNWAWRLYSCVTFLRSGPTQHIPNCCSPATERGVKHLSESSLQAVALGSQETLVYWKWVELFLRVTHRPLIVSPAQRPKNTKLFVSQTSPFIPHRAAS